MPRDDIRTRPVWIPIAAPAEADGYMSNHASTHEDGGSDFVTPGIHHTRHENGGVDEVNIFGLDGYVADPQNAYKLQGRYITAVPPADGQVVMWSATRNRWEPQPVAAAPPGPHHASHENGGGDEVNIAGLDGYVADPQNAYQIQGRFVTAQSPTDGQNLAWSAARNRWEPQPDGRFLDGYAVAHSLDPLDGYQLEWDGGQFITAADRLSADGYFHLRETLDNSGTGFGDDVGNSVVVAACGDTIAVGSPNEGVVPRGIVRVYQFYRGRWILRQEISPPTVYDDLFGWSIALDNRTLAVYSALYMTVLRGAIHVYTRSGTEWSLEQSIALNAVGAFRDAQKAVALSGDTMVVGLPCEPPANQGLVKVFVRHSGIWSLLQTLTGTGASTNEQFGDVVSMHKNTLAVLETGSVPPRTHVFVRSGGSWSLQQTIVAPDGRRLATVAVENDTLVVGRDTGTIAGLAWVFSRADGYWSAEQTITDPDADLGAEFGRSIDIKNGLLAIGNYRTYGKIYTYLRYGGAWRLQQRLRHGSDHFGERLSLSDRWLAGCSFAANGSVHLFGNEWRFADHALSHRDGYRDELDLTGLDGYLGTLQDAYAIQGRFVTAATPANNNGLVWSVARNRWEPGSPYPIGHAASHQDGGADEINVGGLDGYLNQPQTPLHHSTTHITGGTDPVPNAVPSGAAGLMSGADKAYLDGLVRSDSTPENTLAGVGTPGISSQLSRADHRHETPISAVEALVVGGANDNGVSTYMARGDHKHGLPAFGTAAGTFCQGNDSRLSDARTPLAHKTSHENGGSDEISVAGLDGYLNQPQTPLHHSTSHQPGGSDQMAVDQSAATGSLRTLGTGAQQACAGNDARLSDSRNPLAHKVSHQDGGSDEISVAGLDGYLAQPQNADKLQGRFVTAVAPEDNQVLGWDAAQARWEPKTMISFQNILAMISIGI